MIVELDSYFSVFVASFNKEYYLQKSRVFVLMRNNFKKLKTKIYNKNKKMKVYL